MTAGADRRVTKQAAQHQPTLDRTAPALRRFFSHLFSISVSVKDTTTQLQKSIDTIELAACAGLQLP